MSPSPEQIEYAEMLHRLASGDRYACRKLADDAQIDDHIIGFHAQQAVEKALKVTLVLADSELPHTHDLELLVEQANALPRSSGQARRRRRRCADDNLYTATTQERGSMQGSFELGHGQVDRHANDR